LLWLGFVAPTKLVNKLLAGHFPQNEMPAKTAAFVIDFLKRSSL
jgi:hypothetical protein